jgi:hypothetical protein
MVRGEEIDPGPHGRVIIEAEECMEHRNVPISMGREQLRRYRASDPNATIVVTDRTRRNRKPIVYRPGKQPPTEGYIPKGTEDEVDYP